MTGDRSAIGFPNLKISSVLGIISLRFSRRTEGTRISRRLERVPIIISDAISRQTTTAQAIAVRRSVKRSDPAGCPVAAKRAVPAAPRIPSAITMRWIKMTVITACESLGDALIDVHP